MPRYQVIMQYPYTRWFEKIIEVEAADVDAAKTAASEREAKDDEDDGSSFWENAYEAGDGQSGDTEITEVEALDDDETES